MTHAHNSHPADCKITQDAPRVYFLMNFVRLFRNLDVAFGHFALPFLHFYAFNIIHFDFVLSPARNTLETHKNKQRRRENVTILHEN